MLLGGDEFGRSQQGNNNAYCQDTRSAGSPSGIGPDGERLIAFVRRLIALRRPIRRCAGAVPAWPRPLG